VGYAKADAPPTWYRLSEESWAEIRRGYPNGSTARELAARWRVSVSTIYRHACDEGWTKKKDGDAKARKASGLCKRSRRGGWRGGRRTPP
jgi:DNA invertase Pin-like site-specific DNA recombinase